MSGKIPRPLEGAFREEGGALNRVTIAGADEVVADDPTTLASQAPTTRRWLKWPSVSTVDK